VAILGIVAALTGTACSDTAVPYFDSPTAVPNTAGGIQNAVTGFFSASRVDVQWYIYYAGSFGRDLFWFLGASPNVLVDVGGLKQITTSGIDALEDWDNEYAQIKQANTILSDLPKVSTYSHAQAEAIWGMVQTMKAVNFLLVAETRDTLGIPLYSMDANPTDPPYCNKDVWKYIVALLDSANDSLNVAGAIPLPVAVPPGFASVGSSAGPSTVQGSFAAFNRALAGKAGLEYAYAIARNTPGTHPTPTSAGNPDPSALTRADSALTASALYNPSVIAPPVAGPFSLDAYGVYDTFSGQSGDLPNGFVGSFFLYDALYDLQNDVDTLNDLRWLNKFIPDEQPVQLAEYAGVSDAKNFFPYKTVGAPIPIVRAEELALVRAQIQLGMGNYAAAITLINQVHQQAGGFATPLSIAPTYTAVRDSLMKEQRISTVYESSGDRMIAIRMYGLESVADTTWQATAGPDAVVTKALSSTDFHTTVADVPVQEYSARGGVWNLTCP
jgi:starch-binding outer membrane protein, SusD/RagB family